MKAVLSRCALRRSIGVAIDEKRVAVSVVDTTPLGRQQVFNEVRACDAEPPQASLERLLEPWIKQRPGKKPRNGPWVQLGVPESQVFQAVVPITPANQNATPQSYFLEAVQATSFRAEERIIDLVKLELNKQSIACVAASPRQAIQSMTEMMDGLGMRIGLIEPGPAALYRVGAFYRRIPHSSKLAARFFLGQNQAIGVLAAGSQPLFWHTFDLPAVDETTAILAAYSTLWMLWRHSRVSLPIDTVVIHGRPDLTLTKEADAFRQTTGARLIRCNEPQYGPATIALGVALANPLADETGLDLARNFKPPVSVREIFPWGELALHGALVGAVSLFLMGTAAEGNVRLQAIDSQRRAIPWLKQQDQAKLELEKKSLQERLKSVEAFQGKSVGWSGVLRTVASAVPESTTITGLAGEAELEANSNSGMTRQKKQLIVHFATPMSEDGAVPPEIDGFLSTLRGEPSLKRHFPLIEVSGLKVNPTRAGKPPFASYSVVCLPKLEAIKTAKPH